MAGRREFVNIWKTVGEVDLRPIREDALRDIHIVLVGEEGSGRHTLAEQMWQDPSRPSMRAQTPVAILDLDEEAGIQIADLIILMVDAAAKDFTRQQALARQWIRAGKKVLVFYNLIDEQITAATPDLDMAWDAHRLVVGRANDPQVLLKQFVPSVMDLLPGDLLPLARRFPLFRVPVANHLINDTSLSNAAYSLSTSLAELVPVLNIPFNIADMVVLTKAQAFLVYRLGLAFGFSTRWQDYIKEFGGVIGTGFLWRQMARYLVGLIPVIGIIPKVAVAYSGTFVIGEAILGWYLTGRHVSPRQIRDQYRLAYWRGRATALSWLSKAPRLGLFGRRPEKQLALPGQPKRAKLPSLPARRKREKLPPAPAAKDCPNCGKSNAADARFCQYCGQALPQPSEEAV